MDTGPHRNCLGYPTGSWASSLLGVAPMNLRELEKTVSCHGREHLPQTGCVSVRQIYQVLKASSCSAVKSQGPGSQEWGVWVHRRSEGSEHWDSGSGGGERQGNRQTRREGQ